jgi:hypothetical protein
VGYRWYNQHKVSGGLTGYKNEFHRVFAQVTPRYCFGHGLSYTTFSFGALVITGQNVTLTIRNMGSVTGSEVAQVRLPAFLRLIKVTTHHSRCTFRSRRVPTSRRSS